MNFLLVSPPGWGKTTSACTGRHPTLLVDVDGKAHEMVNLRPLIDRGDVTVKTFTDKIVEDRLKDRALHPDVAPKKQPTGYLSIVDYLNDIIDGEPEFDKYNTIILDSLSRVSDHHISLLVYHRGQGKFGKKKEDDMNWPSWGTYLKNWVELIIPLCSNLKQDFICTAHLKIMEKTTVTVIAGGQAIETTEVIGYKPHIDGQMRDKLAGYFNEVYFLEAKTSGKDPKYSFRTRGTKYDARTSLPLDEFEEANIMKLLKKAGVEK